jgi:hypothetical protein
VASRRRSPNTCCWLTEGWNHRQRAYQPFRCDPRGIPRFRFPGCATLSAGPRPGGRAGLSGRGLAVGPGAFDGAGERGAGGNAHLVEDVAQMGLDGLFGSRTVPRRSAGWSCGRRRAASPGVRVRSATYACSVGLARADPVGAAARRLSGGSIYVFARECRDHPPGALDDPLVRLAPDDRPHDRGCRFLAPRCGGA